MARSSNTSRPDLYRDGAATITKPDGDSLGQVAGALRRSQTGGRALARPLFELSEKALRERGNFLPHAAALTDEARSALVGAMCNTAAVSQTPWHIMPMLL